MSQRIESRISRPLLSLKEESRDKTQSSHWFSSRAISAELAFGQAQTPEFRAGFVRELLPASALVLSQALIDLQHDKTRFGDFFTDGLSRIQDIESVSDSPTLPWGNKSGR